MSCTKNILTREVCVKEFENELNKRKPALIGSSVGLLIFGMLLIFLGVIMMTYIFELGLIFTVVFVFAIILDFWFTIRDFVALRMLKKGKFSVVKDEVCRKAEGKWNYWYMGRRSRIERAKLRDVDNFLYFTRHGKYIVSDTVFSMTDQWDTFYLVVLDGRKPRILAAYHSDMYDGEGCC